MKFTYYIIPNYLNSKQISKINFLCKKAQSFNKSAETIKTSTAKQINFDEVRKIITTLKLPNKSNPKEWRTFRKHTQLLDRSRKQDFKYTFPRAEELYKVYKLT